MTLYNIQGKWRVKVNGDKPTSNILMQIDQQVLIVDASNMSLVDSSKIFSYIVDDSSQTLTIKSQEENAVLYFRQSNFNQSGSIKALIEFWEDEEMRSCVSFMGDSLQPIQTHQ